MLLALHTSIANVGGVDRALPPRADPPRPVDTAVIVADAIAFSEFMKERPSSKVLAWAQALDAADLTISVVTVEEVERGLGRLPAGGNATSPSGGTS